jgi:hypothetical protein
VKIKTEYQSMSETKKALEAGRASTPTTPTKPRIASLTPVPIPGMYTPRRVFLDQPWRVKTPNNKAAQPSRPPSVSSQPIKGILKTPERGQFSGGKTAQSTGQSKSSRKRKKKKNQSPKVAWQDDIKREHGSY